MIPSLPFSHCLGCRMCHEIHSNFFMCVPSNSTGNFFSCSESQVCHLSLHRLRKEVERELDEITDGLRTRQGLGLAWARVGEGGWQGRTG